MPYLRNLLPQNAATSTKTVSTCWQKKIHTALCDSSFIKHGCSSITGSYSNDYGTLTGWHGQQRKHNSSLTWHRRFGYIHVCPLLIWRGDENQPDLRKLMRLYELRCIESCLFAPGHSIINCHQKDVWWPIKRRTDKTALKMFYNISWKYVKSLLSTVSSHLIARITMFGVLISWD